MILKLRALLTVSILTIAFMGLNGKPQKAHSQNLDFLTETGTPGLTPMSESSEVSDAETLLLQALEVANSLEDPYRRATLLNDIAIKYANLGKIERSREILDQSLAVARTIEDIGDKVTIMGAIAQHYAEIEQLTTANAILSETVEIANSVEDKSLQAALLSEIALKYADIGQQSQTEILLSQSQEILEQASLPVPDFPFQRTPLGGRFTLDGEIFEGNNSERGLSAALRLGQQFERRDFSVYIDYNTNFDSSRTKDRYRTRIYALGGYNYHFDQTWKLFTIVRFERNIEDGIFYDIEPLVGPSINIFRRGSERTLDLGFGVGVRYQDAIGKSSDLNLPTLGIALGYKDLFWDSWKFNQTLFVSYPPKNGDDWRLSSNTELLVPLWEKWFFTTRFRYIFRGIPSTSKSNSELRFTTGVSYEF